MPGDVKFLIDAGGRPDFRRGKSGNEPFERDMRSIGEGVVSEFLWSQGLDRVDYILATHADADHIDGLNDVLKNFMVRAAFVGRIPLNDVEFERFRATTTTQSVPLLTIQAGDALQFGNVLVDVMWPRPGPGTEQSRNDDSLVVRLRIGTRSLLLTGDIEKPAELALLQVYPDLTADVVKVAHHGSRTSSTEKFVAATHAKYAIIPVGRNSMFGHPHAEVVKRWSGSGAVVLTTGKCGMIRVESDGQQLDVRTFVPCE
jgi:competence protein ComEC